MALLEALLEALKPPDTVKNPSSTSISGHHPGPRAPHGLRTAWGAQTTTLLQFLLFTPQNLRPDSRQVGLCTVSVHAVRPCVPGTPVEVSSRAPRLSGQPLHGTRARGSGPALLWATRRPLLCLPLQHRGTGMSYLGRTRHRAEEEWGEETPAVGMRLRETRVAGTNP